MARLAPTPHPPPPSRPRFAASQWCVAYPNTCHPGTALTGCRAWPSRRIHGVRHRLRCRRRWVALPSHRPMLFTALRSISVPSILKRSLESSRARRALVPTRPALSPDSCRLQEPTNNPTKYLLLLPAALRRSKAHTSRASASLLSRPAKGSSAPYSDVRLSVQDAPARKEFL